MALRHHFRLPERALWRSCTQIRIWALGRRPEITFSDSAGVGTGAVDVVVVVVVVVVVSEEFLWRFFFSDGEGGKPAAK